MTTSNRSHITHRRAQAIRADPVQGYFEVVEDDGVAEAFEDEGELEIILSAYRFSFSWDAQPYIPSRTAARR
jgi:hypothetical protein